jgi:Na+-transporting NADH:ubiquinone oxidoreductase subunit NqrC
MLKKAQNQSEQLIDHVFIRGIQLLAASLVCGVILSVVFIGLKRKKVADAD